jgi:hypothetical protein
MNTNVSPFGIAQIVARNITPLVGIIFFHWEASYVLILYFLDTMLSMAVIFAGLAKSLTPVKGDGIGARIKAEMTYVLVAAFLATVMAVPLGMPVGIALAAADFSPRLALGDESLRFGMLVQCVMAFWSYVDLYRALDTHSPTELKLKQRFGLVLMRWVVVLGVCYIGLGLLPVEFVVFLLVAAYIGASIFAEIAPDRFLRGTPGAEFAADSSADGASRKAGHTGATAGTSRKHAKDPH